LQPPRQVVVDEEATEPSYGYPPSRRPVEALLQYGYIALDKPRGPTSHEVVAWVRKMIGAERAGHSGTLDPAVSGLLPIGLGQATKALSLLLLYPKEYWGILRLHSSVPRRQLDAVVAEFTGEIFQRPPQRSSVKRSVRSRTIYQLEVAEAKGNLYLMRCLCQAGTYIRKLFYDIGEVLSVGGTMVELRRTMVGPLKESDGFVTLHRLSDAVYKMRQGDDSEIRRVVKPVEDFVVPLKRVVVRDSAVDAICHGARLAVPGVLSLSEGIAKDDTLVILTGKGELVAIGKALLATPEVENAKRGLVATTERVVMAQGTYPKLWKHAEKGPKAQTT
jgi:tRNA pseudouridine55 synthase